MCASVPSRWWLGSCLAPAYYARPWERVSEADPRAQLLAQDRSLLRILQPAFRPPGHAPLRYAMGRAGFFSAPCSGKSTERGVFFRPPSLGASFSLRALLCGGSLPSGALCRGEFNLERLWRTPRGKQTLGARRIVCASGVALLRRPDQWSCALVV